MIGWEVPGLIYRLPIPSGLGKAEVESRVVGEYAIAGLKAVDQVAYIRYAIVYLGLDDLQAVRNEIDRLLEG